MLFQFPLAGSVSPPRLSGRGVVISGLSIPSCGISRLAEEHFYVVVGGKFYFQFPLAGSVIKPASDDYPLEKLSIPSCGIRTVPLGSSRVAETNVAFQFPLAGSELYKVLLNSCYGMFFQFPLAGSVCGSPAHRRTQQYCLSIPSCGISKRGNMERKEVCMAPFNSLLRDQILTGLGGGALPSGWTFNSLLRDQLDMVPSASACRRWFFQFPLAGSALKERDAWEPGCSLSIPSCGISE